MRRNFKVSDEQAQSDHRRADCHVPPFRMALLDEVRAAAQQKKQNKRMKVFKQWLTLHQDEYPEVYRKYCQDQD
jgi:hypothetical protein